MTIEIIEPEARGCARAAKAAANHMRSIHPGGPLAKVASALPGSDCAGSAEKARAKVHGDIEAWAKQADDHHDKTIADIDALVKADQKSADEARRQQSGPDGPPVWWGF